MTIDEIDDMIVDIIVQHTRIARYFAENSYKIGQEERQEIINSVNQLRAQREELLKIRAELQLATH